MIVEFYKAPLSKAIIQLMRDGKTLEEISQIVFKGEVSAQAIHQNYVKKGGKH